MLNHGSCHLSHVRFDGLFHFNIAMFKLQSQLLMLNLNLPENPSQEDGSLSFTSHHPTKDIIPSCVCPHKKLTNAQKISANTKCELNKENANALKVEVNAFFAHRNTEISRLAKKIQQGRSEYQAPTRQRKQISEDACTIPSECVGTCQRSRDE